MDVDAQAALIVAGLVHATAGVDTSIGLGDAIHLHNGSVAVALVARHSAETRLGSQWRGPLDMGIGIAAGNALELQLIALGQADDLIAGPDLHQGSFQDAYGSDAGGLAHLVLGPALVVAGIGDGNVRDPAGI